MLQLAPILATIENGEALKKGASTKDDTYELFNTLLQLLKERKGGEDSVTTELQALKKESVDDLPSDLVDPKRKDEGTVPYTKPRHSLASLLRVTLGDEATSLMRTESKKGGLAELLSANRKKPADPQSEIAKKGSTTFERSEWNARALRADVLLDDRFGILQEAARFREAKGIRELIAMARKRGLNPQKVVFEHTPASSERAVSVASKQIPDHRPAISVPLLSAVVAKTLTESKIRKEPARNEISSNPLQSLLTEVRKKSNGTTAIHRTQKEKIHDDLNALLAFARAKKTRPAMQTGNVGEERPKESGHVTTYPEPSLDATRSESLDFRTSESPAPNIETMERKVADARATVRHFARTLQERVENYKPPFQRMQITLDPKELGNVEVTLVSRGNNLHIQVHSNPGAIGLLATQGQELKQQLVSMGFTDVQMQFNMNQQQQRQQQRQSPNGGYVPAEEVPEFYESLELIVPQYV